MPHPSPNQGAAPPQNLSTQIDPWAPQASGEKPHGGIHSTALLSHAPSRRKSTHHTHSCLNLQACNPTHVLPARRRPGGPASDLLSFVAGSADLYAEFCEQAEAVIRVWLHLCLTPLLTSPQPPILARLLPDFRRCQCQDALTSSCLRAHKMFCEDRKLPPVTQRILARQGGYLQPQMNTVLTQRSVLQSAHPDQSSTHNASFCIFFLIFHSQESWVWLRHRADLESKALKIQMCTPRADLIRKYYGKHGHASS